MLAILLGRRPSDEDFASGEDSMILEGWPCPVNASAALAHGQSEGFLQ
jgi:hypothetical protein